MEERIRPRPPPPPPFSITGDEIIQNQSLNHFDLPPPPQHRQYTTNETYIVQVPKDQIYWVPPPEHAQIVERYRNPDRKVNRVRPVLCWTVSVIIALAAIAGIISAVYYLTLNPRDPNFQVKQFTVHQGKPVTSFRVRLELANPNSANVVWLSQGTATLLFKGKDIARGKSPVVKQNPMGVDEEEVALTTNTGLKLPKEVEDSLTTPSKKTGGGSNFNKSNKGLALTLKMRVPLNKKTWMMDKKKVANVKCDLLLNSLANKNAKIHSQKCTYL